MKLVIRSYRAIDSASITLGGITLVAGPNGAGKTSLSEGLGALLSRTAMLVDGVLVKDARDVVRDGEAEATADLQFGKAEQDHLMATWPKAKVLGDLAGAPEASMIAIGQDRFTSIPKLPDRVKALARYVPGTPSDKEIRETLAEAGYGEESILHVLARLRTITWDEMHKKAVDNGTSLKGKWSGVTGEEFGPAKADGWKPAAYVDITDEAVEAAQAAYDEIVGERALVMDRLPVLQAAVEKGDGIDLAVYRSALQNAENELEAVEEERSALGSPDDGLPCPHCANAITVQRDHATGHVTLLKAEAALSTAELRDLRRQIASADGKVSRQRSAMDTARINLDVAKATVETAAKAAAELETMSGVDIEKVLTAKAVLDDALRRRADAKRIADARDHFLGWSKNKKLIDMLAPDGLRRKAMQRDMTAFNARLKTLSEAAGWPVVAVEPDFDLSLGGRSYHLLSKSMQYRADVTLQVACAQVDGSAMVVIDGADILDKGGRNGLFGMLSEAAIPALVTMTLSAPKLVPDLAAAGLGRSYWIADGRTSNIGESDD